MTRAYNTATTQQNSGGAVNPFVAGKNKIINGDFGIWQRGTSFTANNAYTADRFIAFHDGTVTATTSQQTFALGTAPVAGYEGQYFIRKATTSQTGGTYNTIQQPIESVRTFAGQTMTVSFWAKASASANISVNVNQDFGSSGSPSATVSNNSGTIAITTSWVRYSYTVTLASIAGKTITTGDKLVIAFNMPLNAASTIDIWGVQAEAGSVATAFQTATGTIQGELAACQRYYQRFNSASVYLIGMANAQSTTAVFGVVDLTTTMRVRPTTLDINLLRVTDTNAGFSPSGAWSIYSNGSGTDKICLTNGTFTGLTQFRTYLYELDGASAYVGVGAEL